MSKININKLYWNAVKQSNVPLVEELITKYGVDPSQRGKLNLNTFLFVPFSGEVRSLAGIILPEAVKTHKISQQFKIYLRVTKQ